MDVGVTTVDVGEWTSQMIGARLMAIETEHHRLDGEQLMLLRELGRREQCAPVEYVQRISLAELNARVNVAHKLDTLPGAQELLAQGAVGYRHLRPLVELRDRLTDEQITTLLGEAKTVSPGSIARRAHRRAEPVEGIKPEGATGPSPRGGVRYEFDLSMVDGEIVREALDAIMDQAWRKQHPDREPSLVERASWRERFGEAFVELCRRYQTGTISGGAPRYLIHVVMTVNWLLGHLDEPGICETIDGRQLPIGEIRKLLADADIIPYVLGGDSEVLDMGRKRRFFTAKQKQAIRVRDGICCVGDCDSAGPLQAHHNIGYAEGGPTDLANGAGACVPCHKHRLDKGWHIVTHGDTINTYDPTGTLVHTRTRGRQTRKAA